MFAAVSEEPFLFKCHLSEQDMAILEKALDRAAAEGRFRGRERERAMEMLRAIKRRNS